MNDDTLDKLFVRRQASNASEPRFSSHLLVPSVDDGTLHLAEYYFISDGTTTEYGPAERAAVNETLTYRKYDPVTGRLVLEGPDYACMENDKITLFDSFPAGTLFTVRYHWKPSTTG